jgi:hypothetical protein
MGKVYLDIGGNAFVWQEPFPHAMQRQLVSHDNPSGDVTNSNLEHVGLLAQVNLMTHTHDVCYATLENFPDNTPAVSQVRKGAVSAAGAAAGLCRFASNHQRIHRYCHRAQYLPGDSNCMADDASRLQHLSDADFLSLFNQRYPQQQPWELLALKPEMALILTSALLCNLHPPPTPPRTKDGRSKIFGKWTAFCHSIGKRPDLKDVLGTEHKLA